MGGAAVVGLLLLNMHAVSAALAPGDTLGALAGTSQLGT
jgi:hypothetical protein